MLRIYKQLDVVPVNSLVIAVPITPPCFFEPVRGPACVRARVCVFKRSDMNKSTSVCVSLIYTLSTKSPFRLLPVYSCYRGADGTCHTHKSRRGLRELAPPGWMQLGYGESSFSFFGTPFAFKPIHAPGQIKVDRAPAHICKSVCKSSFQHCGVCFLQRIYY